VPRCLLHVDSALLTVLLLVCTVLALADASMLSDDLLLGMDSDDDSRYMLHHY
jgi:hypothetical protein